jgi:hypothetical protein
VIGVLSLNFVQHFLKISFSETVNKSADYVRGIGTFSINSFRTLLLVTTVALNTVRSEISPLQRKGESNSSCRGQFPAVTHERC